MYHSLVFESKDGIRKNTWDDWFLIPASRPVINPPAPKTIYVNIPGADSALDLSESLSGGLGIAYEDREGSLSFIVDNGHASWFRLYSDISNFLHGKQMKLFLEDEPEYYYYGRFTVESWNSGSRNSAISIGYHIEPYKYCTLSSLDDWKWDSFNFENGIIREWKDIEIHAGEKLIFIGDRKPIVPTFKVESQNGNGIHISLINEFYSTNGGGYSTVLHDGDNRDHNIIFSYGNNVIRFYRMVGDNIAYEKPSDAVIGHISVGYTGGSL